MGTAKLVAIGALFSLRSVFSRQKRVTPPEIGLTVDWSALGGPQEATLAPSVNPLVEELMACQTDAERAQWLLHIPLSFIATRQAEIEDALLLARYTDGLTYLTVMAAALSQRRDADGFHSMAISRLLDREAVRLRVAVRPDHALLVPQRSQRGLAIQPGAEKA